jgi:hypothetical protein
MVSVGRLKSAFLKAVTKPIGTRGYKTKRREIFLTLTDFGFLGVFFTTKDYGYLGTILEYCVRHDIVSDTLFRATEIRGWGGWEGKALEQLKKEMREDPTFSMSYNAIIGRQEHTTDDITTEEEIPDLCKRWLQRYDETADQFFSKFSNINTVASMYENDDPFLAKLFNSDMHAAVGHGVATLHAVRGLEAARAYAKRHEKMMTQTNKVYGDIILAAPSPKDRKES